MKSHFIGVILCALSASSSSLVASASPVELHSRIKSVIVYADRALIKREAAFEIAAGQNTIVITGITQLADEVSLRASLSTNNARILGLAVKPAAVRDDDVRRKDLRRRLDSLWGEAAVSENRIFVLTKQQQMLENLASNASAAASGSPSAGAPDSRNWEAAFLNVGKYLNIVLDSIRAMRIRDAQTRERCHALERELAAADSVLNRPVRDVAIEVECRAPVRGVAILEYLVPRTSWRALYNARLLDSNQVEIEYLAEVTQASGEDWDDVQLILSTAQPSRATGPRELSTRPVTVLETGAFRAQGGRSGETETQIIVAQRDLMQKSWTADSIAEPAPFEPYGLVGVAASATDFSTQFVLSRSESIRSGEFPSRVVVAILPFTGELSLIARPQLDQHAFRSLKLTNTTATPLLPGEISLFAGGDYIGKLSSPMPIVPQQEFNLSFGIDDGIEIKREPSGRRTEIKGDRRSISQRLVTTVANHADAERTVKIEEALPFSADSRVRVDIKSTSPRPTQADAQGRASWELRLRASEQAVIIIEYEVEFPSDVNIHGL